jgi:hypothetical protein
MAVAVVDRPQFRRALDAPVPALAVRDAIAEALAEDPSSANRAALIVALEELREHFRRIGRPEVEDVLLEAMDFASGWCNPRFAV